MKVHYILISIVTILLTACSSSIIPLQATPDSIEVKIENFDKGKIYKLISSGKGEVARNITDESGFIRFDITEAFNYGVINCFYVTDDNKNIPIKDEKYKFTNPALTNYMFIKNDYIRELANLQQNQNSLNNNNAYRNGECTLIPAEEPPKKPSNACDADEEESFSTQQCQNIQPDTSAGRTIKNSLISGVVGTIVGAVTGGVGGLIAGVASDLYLNNSDEQERYKDCIAKSLNDCRFYYNNWDSDVRNVKQYPQILLNQCRQTQQNIRVLEELTNNLKEKLNNAGKLELPIAEYNYGNCY